MLECSSTFCTGNFLFAPNTRNNIYEIGNGHTYFLVRWVNMIYIRDTIETAFTKLIVVAHYDMSTVISVWMEGFKKTFQTKFCHKTNLSHHSFFVQFRRIFCHVFCDSPIPRVIVSYFEASKLHSRWVSIYHRAIIVQFNTDSPSKYMEECVNEPQEASVTKLVPCFLVKHKTNLSLKVWRSRPLFQIFF